MTTTPPPSVRLTDRRWSSGADIDPTGTYRYRLWRRWDHTRYRVVFIMLNPSTADALEDDPTIRRCLGFALRWGAGGFEVVNLFALRATNPKQLDRHPNPRGPENKAFVMRAMLDAGLVVVAWGGSLPKNHPRLNVRQIAQSAQQPLHCLGTTKSGEPRHPLFVPYSTPLQSYDRA